MAIGAITAVIALALSSCTSRLQGSVSQGRPITGTPTGSLTPAAGTPTSTGPLPGPAVITAPHTASNLNPATPISVSVASGTLTSVRLTNPDGKLVQSHLALDGSAWATTEDLGYGKTYHLTASARGTDGTTSSTSAILKMLTPSNQTMPYLWTTGGFGLQNGATYGIGLVPVVYFDEPVTDRAAAEQALIVTTSPHVDGVWNWVDSQHVHWRSQHYFETGSRVTVTAKMYGVQVGPGLYGQADQSVSFKIGAKHISIADDATHTVKVFFNNALVRTMATSMGRGGYVTGGSGQQIPLWTMPGTYTVITHENPAIMSSDSYGLPANSPAGYAPEAVYWSTKISTDGIYLHELDATVWAQGNTDVSHGCLNLNYDNAKWYFQNSLVGDVVQVTNVHQVDGQKATPVAIWQNGDWTVPWSTWVKGSALHH